MTGIFEFRFKYFEECRIRNLRKVVSVLHPKLKLFSEPQNLIQPQSIEWTFQTINPLKPLSTLCQQISDFLKVYKIFESHKRAQDYPTNVHCLKTLKSLENCKSLIRRHSSALSPLVRPIRYAHNIYFICFVRSNFQNYLHRLLTD